MIAVVIVVVVVCARDLMRLKVIDPCVSWLLLRRWCNGVVDEAIAVLLLDDGPCDKLPPALCVCDTVGRVFICVGGSESCWLCV